MARQRPNSRMKRVKAMLEIAAGAYGERKLDLGVALDISIRSSDEEDNIFPPLRLGVHGELMGGMKAPIEVGAARLNIREVCRDTDAGPLGIPPHPGAKRFYEENGYL